MVEFEIVELESEHVPDECEIRDKEFFADNSHLEYKDNHNLYEH